MDCSFRVLSESKIVGADSESHPVAMRGYVDFEGSFCRVGNTPVSLRSAR